MLGLSTADQLRSSAWRRLFRGVHVDAAVPDTHGVRVAGARLLLPPAGVLSGRSAAWLLGVGEAAGPGTPVQVTVPRAHRFGPVTGLVIRQAEIPGTEVAVTGGGRRTTALRTACDLARHEPTGAAVALLDVLLSRGARATGRAAGPRRSGRGRSRLAAGRTGGGTGRRARRVAARVADAGAPGAGRTGRRPAVRGPDDEGRWPARVDLAFPELRVALEHDGAWQGAPSQLAEDRRRLMRLVAAGWRVLHLTAADLHHPTGVVGSGA